jgi:hypothetical protein
VRSAIIQAQSPHYEFGWPGLFLRNSRAVPFAVEEGYEVYNTVVLGVHPCQLAIRLRRFALSAGRRMLMTTERVILIKPSRPTT